MQVGLSVSGVLLLAFLWILKAVLEDDPCYAYPACKCYRNVEKNKPENEQLRFWCQYWILVAVLTVCEQVGDTKRNFSNPRFNRRL
ncbi:HVA22-like protein i [Rosa chinensis]|uniref:HVA22-like protein i n=1 Tax=Rosa chinensis TaxID=74649 RepID=UPI001AD92F62|nr:HVA22-like protein i [Rosa chinensis]